MHAPFALGSVGHIVIAVRDPRRSADWFCDVLGLRGQFEYENAIAVGNDNVTLVLAPGTPDPAVLKHVSFHLPDVATLQAALRHLQKHEVNIEDPGDEIGPEGPGSPNMGLWFRDADGYRWELSVLADGLRAHKPGRGAALPAAAVGALALGAFIGGACAVAALAVGTVAIGSASIGSGHIRRLRIEDLSVGDLHRGRLPADLSRDA